MEFLVPGSFLLAVYIKNGYIPVTGHRTLEIEIAENFRYQTLLGTCNIMEPEGNFIPGMFRSCHGNL